MGKFIFGVLASGRGSNFQSIIDHIKLGVLKNAKCGVLISNNKDSNALKIAEQNGIENEFLDHRNRSRELYDKEIVDILSNSKVELVILSGFMRILSSYLIKEYKNKIMNIHPSLLPSFPGLHSHKQTIDYGVKISGCTVHYVDEGVDAGPIILQHAVPIKEDDTEEILSDRILIFEHRIYPKAIQLHVDGRLTITGRKVKIDYSNDWEDEWNKRQKNYIENQLEKWKNKIKFLV